MRKLAPLLLLLLRCEQGLLTSYTTMLVRLGKTFLCFQCRRSGSAHSLPLSTCRKSQSAFLSSATPPARGGVGAAAAASDLAVEDDSALEGADPNATWGGGALRWWAAERFVMSAEWRWCWFRSSVRSITIV